MIVKVLGSEHISGVSQKTGKPYDMNKVYCSFKSDRVTGEAVREFFLPVGFDASRILVGQHYNFDFDFTGRLTSISPAKV